MKYTIEITPNGMIKTFEFKGKRYKETWIEEESGTRCTTGPGITTQLDNDGILDGDLEEYIDLTDALEVDDLDELWDQMKYWQEENEE